MGQSIDVNNGNSGGGVSSFEDLIEGFALSGNGDKIVGINTAGDALEPKTDPGSITDSDDITEGSTNLFLTSAERTKLTSTSGTNTGDQDISGISTNASNILLLSSLKADKSNVLEKDNSTSFTPSADYHPATKKYVDDAVVGGGGYTDEQAQDAVGGILSAEFTYNDAGNAISINDISADKISDGTTNKAYTATEKTKLSNIEENADVTDATNVDAAGAVMNTDTTTASMSFVIDEDDMTSNSATKVPTQQSVKAYVDAHAGGTGAETIQTKTLSSESAGSVDLSLGHWLELNCDADGSLSIIDTADVVAGYTYKIDCKNTKSPSGNVTLTIPTGWVSQSYSTIVIKTAEYVLLELTKSSTGLIILKGASASVL